MGRYLHRACQCWRAAGSDTDRFLRRASAPMRIRRQRGEHSQAIGRSRGGRTTKIHALTDDLWRPVAFLLTGGNVADCTAGETLLEQLPDTRLVNGDKGYDSNAIRRQISDRGAFANIPPKANRIWKNCFSPFASGRTASRRSSTATETPSNACSAASRTSGALQPATTAKPRISSPPFRSPQQSLSGYESRP